MKLILAYIILTADIKEYAIERSTSPLVQKLKELEKGILVEIGSKTVKVYFSLGVAITEQSIL